MDRYAQHRTTEASRYLRRVGRRIEWHRERLEWSQRELAERTGWSQGAVAQWEKGKVMPRVEAQLALATVFGVEPDELFSFARRDGER